MGTNQGNKEVFLGLLARMMKKKGHKVSVFAIEKGCQPLANSPCMTVTFLDKPFDI